MNMSIKPQFLSIGGIVIQVDYSKVDNSEVSKTFKEYITPYYRQVFVKKPIKKPDYIVYITSEEQLHIYEKKKPNNELYLRIIQRFPKYALIAYHVSVSHFQFLLKLILRKVLLEQNGFVFHSSAVSDGTNVYLFSGTNGAGKSTLANNLKSTYTHFADDITIIKKIHNTWYAFQFPLQKNGVEFYPYRKQPIKAIFFVHKSKNTRFIKIPLHESNVRILKQIIGATITNKQLEQVVSLVNDIKNIYEIHTPKKASIQKFNSFVSEL